MIQMDYVISEELANNVLRYLQTRPYSEVVNLIVQLQVIKPVEVKKEVEPSAQKKPQNSTG